MEVNELIDKVIKDIEKTADVKASFGEPYEKDGITVIPVAKIQITGGGGGGSGDSTEDNQAKGRGIGLGINVKTIPFGYIKIVDGDAHFVRVLDLNRIAVIGIIFGSLAWMMVAKAAISSRGVKQK